MVVSRIKEGIRRLFRNGQNKQSEVEKFLTELYKRSDLNLSPADLYVAAKVYEDIAKIEKGLYEDLGIKGTDKDGIFRKYVLLKANTVTTELVTANYQVKTNPEKAAAILGGLGAIYGMEGAKMLGYGDVAEMFSDFYRKITEGRIGEKPGEEPTVTKKEETRIPEIPEEKETGISKPPEEKPGVEVEVEGKNT